MMIGQVCPCSDDLCLFRGLPRSENLMSNVERHTRHPNISTRGLRRSTPSEPMWDSNVITWSLAFIRAVGPHLESEKVS